MVVSIKKSRQRAILDFALAAFALCGFAGCHSHYVAAQVRNQSGAPISLLELDYPSASFGKESLAGDATYAYRFKTVGDGPTRILWTDAQHHDHTVLGPSLHEGQEGNLTVTITATTAIWQAQLH